MIHLKLALTPAYSTTTLLKQTVPWLTLMPVRSSSLLPSLSGVAEKLTSISISGRKIQTMKVRVNHPFIPARPRRWLPTLLPSVLRPEIIGKGAVFQFSVFVFTFVYPLHRIRLGEV